MKTTWQMVSNLDDVVGISHQLTFNGDNMVVEHNKRFLDFWFDKAECPYEESDEENFTKWRYEHGRMGIWEASEYRKMIWEPSPLDKLFTEGIDSIPSDKEGYYHLVDVWERGDRNTIATHEAMKEFREAMAKRFSENGNSFCFNYYWYNEGEERYDTRDIRAFWSGTMEFPGHKKVKWSEKLESLLYWSDFKYEFLMDAYSKGQTGLVLESHEDYDEVMFMRCVEQNKKEIQEIGEDIYSWTIDDILDEFLPEEDKTNIPFNRKTPISSKFIRKEIADRVLSICLNENNVCEFIEESKEETSKLIKELKKMGFTINFKHPVSTNAMRCLISHVKDEAESYGIDEVTHAELSWMWVDTHIDDEYMKHFVSYK